jgi:hypothetical protein
MAMEILERVAAAGTQLLRAELQPSGGAGDGVAALLLTFDLGRVLLHVDPATGLLAEHLLDAGDATPPALEVADEEEPWWRVLGSPLVRALEINPGQGVLGVALQFRQDADNPRRIAILARGEGLTVQLQQPSPSPE